MQLRKVLGKTEFLPVREKGSQDEDRKAVGGQFEEMPPKALVDFLSGRDVKGLPPCDQNLISYDLWGSRGPCSHALSSRHLSKQDGKKILKGFKEIDAS